MPVVWTLIATLASAAEFHQIHVSDQQGNPVGCAVVETSGRVRFETDELGNAAFYEPGHMDRVVWITPSAVGISPPTDWLGIEGVAVETVEGGSTIIVVQRTAPAGPCAAGDVQTRLLERSVPEAAELHELRVTDGATGRGVPAARVRLGDQEWWTDNDGRIAWFDLDDMATERVFTVDSHGYEDGELTTIPLPGSASTVPLVRNNLAERLYRVTGAGLWADSIRLGYAAPLVQPLVNAGVTGQDTVHVVPWKGGLFWLWGDTLEIQYPLGNFRTTTATSPLTGFDPEAGVDLTYFLAPDGTVKESAPFTDDPAVWMDGLVTIGAEEQIFARFLNIDAAWNILGEGMTTWDEGRSEFRPVAIWAPNIPVKPSGPAFRWKDTAGAEWVVYRDAERVPADAASLADPATYQAFTPLVADGVGWILQRTADGAPDYQWRAGSPTAEPALTDEGFIPAEDSLWYATFDPDTGEDVAIHNGAVRWSPWRGRFVHVFTENGGDSSYIGEIWYTEGDTPTGPWGYARKIITHDDYSWYNPFMHPWWSSDGGRRILFEGTYTAWLGTDDLTPRHDYNQQMYALQIDDPAVVIPVPFYGEIPVNARDLDAPARIAFEALDLPGAGRTPYHWTGPACDPSRVISEDGAGEPAFWADPPGTAGRVDLLEFERPDGTAAYAVDGDQDPAWTLVGPVAGVWPRRWQADVQVGTWDRPDRADAGADVCGAPTAVSLDGSASRLAAGISTWTWTWSGGTASGETAEIALDPGLHVITLTVEGPDGTSAQDRVVVSVAVQDDGKTPEDTGGPDDGGDDDPKDESGCGCATSGSPSANLAFAALLVLGRRRR